jgi:isopenicillin-N epimerase
VTPPPEPIPGARLLFQLDPAITYLNHGAFGAVPVPVLRAQRHLRDEMESNPHRFFTSSLNERLGHARRHLSTFLGADPAGTAFVPNTTTGISLVLKSLGLRTGDEVLTTDHGYGAVAMAVQRICVRAGATHRVVPIGLAATDAETVMEIAHAIRPGRTRLIIVDQITSPTARMLPVAAIAAAARRAGVAILVDGAHAPGVATTPIDEIGADFWVGNLHKWLFAPRATALLSAAPHRRAHLEPLVVSWSIDEGFPSHIEMTGTTDYTPWLAAPAGLHFMRTLGVDRVRAHNADLAAYGQRVIGAALGLLSPGDLPSPGAPGTAMRILPLPDGLVVDNAAALRLRARIADELRVEIPVTMWRGRAFLRVSAQVYNHPDDYDRLAAGLPGVLSRRP